LYGRQSGVWFRHAAKIKKLMLVQL